MIRELKQKWDSLPWWEKVIVVIAGLCYIGERERGLFGELYRALLFCLVHC